jgi:hypothetical protein
MITVAEYRRAVWQRWGRLCVSMGGTFLLGTVVFLVLWWILELADPGNDAVQRSEAAMAVAVIAALVGGVGLSTRNMGRGTGDDPRLVCPHCDGPLGHHGLIVLSSRNCPVAASAR